MKHNYENVRCFSCVQVQLAIRSRLRRRLSKNHNPRYIKSKSVKKIVSAGYLLGAPEALPLPVFHRIGNGNCLHAHRRHAHRQVDNFLFIIGEAVGVELLVDGGRTFGFVSLYWSRIHSSAERLPALIRLCGALTFNHLEHADQSYRTPHRQQCLGHHRT
jgi:hypothetical protein